MQSKSVANSGRLNRGTSEIMYVFENGLDPVEETLGTLIGLNFFLYWLCLKIWDIRHVWDICRKVNK